jgi:putative DNA primase/helicase
MAIPTSNPNPRQRLLDAALRAVAQGLHVVPLHEPLPGDLCTCEDPRCTKPGKHPRIRWKDGGRTTPDAVRQDWNDWPTANVGILTGSRSGIFVFDVDVAPERNGVDALARLEQCYGPLPETLMARSGGGGTHYYFRHPGEHVKIKTDADVLGDEYIGLDARGDGGLIVAPCSLHASGARYEWLNAGTPPADAPDWLVALLTGTPARPAQPRARADQHVPQDKHREAQHWLDRYVSQAQARARNETGKDLALQLRDTARLSEDEAEPYMLEYAERVPAGTHPYTAREALATLHSIYREPPREPARSQTVIDARQRFAHDQHNGHHQEDHAASEEHGGKSTGRDEAPRGRKPPQKPEDDDSWGKDFVGTYLRTELGNTRRLYDAHGRDIGFCEAFGFVVWNGKSWEIGAEMVVRHWAQDAIQGLYDEAARLAIEASSAATDEDRNRLAAAAAEAFKWANRSQTDHMVKAMAALVRPYCLVVPDQFDAQPMLFNCQNGTIDLTTGRLRSHARSDFLMQCAPVEYHPEATAPTFERFLREIMLDDGTRPERAELVAYLQRVFGYALTGDVSEQAWHLFVGKGGNGKTTLVEVIERVLGPYAGAMAPESVTITGRPRDGAAPSPDIAALKGKRFTTIPETEEGARLAPSRIKQLSGGDRVTARFLRRDLFTFLPTHKLFIHTNHRPEARETTHGFWRRVRYIPFDFTPTAGKDERLPAKLAAEAEGVLAWLVAGCLEWQRIGLTAPRVVLEETQKYRAEMDVLGAFITERCIVGPNEHERAKTLRAAWVEWCNESGERAGVNWGVRRLGIALGEKGFKHHTNNGVVWDGLRLRTVMDPDPTPSSTGATEPTEGTEGTKVTLPHILPFASPLHTGHAERTEGTEPNLHKKPRAGARKEIFLQVPSVPSVLPSVDDDCEVTFEVVTSSADVVNGTGAHAEAPPPCPYCGCTKRNHDGPDVRCDHCDRVLVPGGAQQKGAR